ncbi:MAG: cytochrome d ubiquinol oxidase subunit II [Verrucomicrobia bacterium]|nr:cytochrome d ubiquinol oxidase subunit II [Verrucomicrobiota bacterium]
MTLELLWYLVVLVALIFYAVLDGFDLGVGCLHLFAKKDIERRTILNSIGPLWDGNEVWLVIVGGALFAGFPDVFATVFSAFYDFVMLLLCGLIFRAVSIEFRSKKESPRWRQTWDVVFSVASFIIAFGLGLVFGNIIVGIPLNDSKDFVGSFLGFLGPYQILFGLTTTALFAMHGSIYLAMKTEGAFHKSIRGWINRTVLLFFGFYVLLTLATFGVAPHMADRMKDSPVLFLVPLLALLTLLNIPRQVKKGNDGWAFLSSCLGIALLLGLFALGSFPTLVRSSINPAENSLTYINAASSPLTLKILLIMVGIGVPFVLGYGFYIYRLFHGKVRLDPHSY